MSEFVSEIIRVYCCYAIIFEEMHERLFAALTSDLAIDFYV